MYEKFKELDGRHPWRDVSPDGYVDYQARYRPHGRVLFFNFPLAKEMGLIPPDHPSSINKDLEQVILDTFSLQIINEYDLQQGKKFPPETIKPHPFMATRYLQTQHRNQQGKTSGDGRSIWNGYLKSDNLTFDISSRGTGATILSPGAQEAKGFVATGDYAYGYSSGLADLDEMLGSAVMSEIFYRQGIPTERCLAVIGFPDTTAIGVRTAPNLIRPAHIFRYLKQGRHEEAQSFSRLLHRSRSRKWFLGDSRRIRRALRKSARLLRPLLRKTRRAARRGVHLQLALVGRRQHARQRRHTRLRLDSTVCRQARQVSLQRRRSLFGFTRGTARLGAERWSRYLRKRWHSSSQV